MFKKILLALMLIFNVCISFSNGVDYVQEVKKLNYLYSDRKRILSYKIQRSNNDNDKVSLYEYAKFLDEKIRLYNEAIEPKLSAIEGNNSNLSDYDRMQLDAIKNNPLDMKISFIRYNNNYDYLDPYDIEEYNGTYRRLVEEMYNDNIQLLDSILNKVANSAIDDLKDFFRKLSFLSDEHISEYNNLINSLSNDVSLEKINELKRNMARDNFYDYKYRVFKDIEQEKTYAMVYEDDTNNQEGSQDYLNKIVEYENRIKGIVYDNNSNEYDQINKLYEVMNEFYGIMGYYYCLHCNEYNYKVNVKLNSNITSFGDLNDENQQKQARNRMVDILYAHKDSFTQDELEKLRIDLLDNGNLSLVMYELFKNKNYLSPNQKNYIKNDEEINPTNFEEKYNQYEELNQLMDLLNEKLDSVKNIDENVAKDNPDFIEARKEGNEAIIEPVSDTKTIYLNDKIKEIIERLKISKTSMTTKINDIIKSLNYNDVSIINNFNKDIYLDVKVSKKIPSDIKNILAGVAIGYNKQVLKDLRVGTFAEYANNEIHYVSLGIDTTYKDFLAFIRYRIAIMPFEENVFLNHSLDTYIKYGSKLKVKDNLYLEPSLALQLIYSSETDFGDIKLNQRVASNLDLAVRMNSNINKWNFYIEPAIRVGYNDFKVLKKNTKEIEVIKGSYLDWNVSLGVEREISKVILGIRAKIERPLKQDVNASINTTISYNF